MIPVLNKTSLSKSFCSLGSGFQRTIYDASEVLPGLSIFWSIWNDRLCKIVVDVASKVFWCFWTLSWIIMFTPSNLRITFGFINVMWTTRTVSFILFLFFKGNKDGLFLVFHVITILKLLLMNFWNFLRKIFVSFKR